MLARPVFGSSVSVAALAAGPLQLYPLARYGEHDEATYRRNYAKDFDWLAVNLSLVKQYLSGHRIIAPDPSYLTKSGKHSGAGVDYFWSGSAGQTEWGQEFCDVAAVDLQDKTALHLLAVQTTSLEEGESLPDYYAGIVTPNAAQLRPVPSYVVANAYFAKARFAESVRSAGLQLNTRVHKDQVLYYLYQSPRHRSGPGRPKQFAGRIDVANLRPDVFTPGAVADDGSWTVCEAVAYVKAWKRKARVVILQRYDMADEFRSHTSLVSTDLDQDGADLVLIYTSHFQQDFLCRDAKQELGLEDCQAYT